MHSLLCDHILLERIMLLMLINIAVNNPPSPPTPTPPHTLNQWLLVVNLFIKFSVC
jgi:hypothetical protein